MNTVRTFYKPSAVQGAKKSFFLNKPWLIAAVGAACAAGAFALVYFIQPSLFKSETPPVTIISAALVPQAATANPVLTEYVTQSEPEVQETQPDREINFTELLERNSDVIGWISVDGTNIDYPVLKSKDNLDYLNRNIDKEDDVYGAIFTDMDNKTGFNDPNTVIYGHNMKNGTMFAALHKFEDKDFFDENRQIKIYTKDGGMKVYEIIAAYKRDNKSILYNKDFSDTDTFNSYVKSIFNNADSNANLLKREVSSGDKLVTLSTCVRGDADHRYVVLGLLNNKV